VSGSEAVAIAVTFVWLGMVVAISFVEAPLKFRAPDVTLRIGLGIGRLVFRALNTAESIFAIVIVVTIVAGLPTAGAVSAAVAVASLVAQLVAIRPRLTRRSDAVLAGEVTPPRASSHHAYIAMEILKVAALLVAGIVLLANSS